MKKKSVFKTATASVTSSTPLNTATSQLPSSLSPSQQAASSLRSRLNSLLGDDDGPDPHARVTPQCPGTRRIAGIPPEHIKNRIGSTVQSTSKRVDELMQAELQRRNRALDEIQSIRRILFVVLTNAAAENFKQVGLDAVAALPPKYDWKERSNPSILDTFKDIIIVMDETMIFDWKNYLPDRVLSVHWQYPSDGIVSLGGTPCRVGLFWYSSAKLATLTTAEAEKFLASAITDSHFITERNFLEDVALSILTLAFPQISIKPGVLRRLARFYLPTSGKFRNCLQSRCLSPNGVPPAKFQSYLLQEEKRRARTRELLQARSILVD